MAEVKSWVSARAPKRKPNQKMRAAEKAEEAESLKQAIERLAADAQVWSELYEQARRKIVEKDARIAGLERRIER